MRTVEAPEKLIVKTEIERFVEAASSICSVFNRFFKEDVFELSRNDVEVIQKLQIIMTYVIEGRRLHFEFKASGIEDIEALELNKQELITLYYGICMGCNEAGLRIGGLGYLFRRMNEVMQFLMDGKDIDKKELRELINIIEKVIAGIRKLDLL